MLRVIAIVLGLLTAVACAGDRTGNGAVSWTPEQLGAFASFRSPSVDDRRGALPIVATAFPVAFYYDTLQAHEDKGLKISQREIVRLLGTPTVRFSFAERPDYIGVPGRSMDFDPRKLQILVYDVDCLSGVELTATEAREPCSSMDVIMLNDTVLRATVTQESRGRASKALRALMQGGPWN